MIVPTLFPHRRTRCARCTRPTSACICRWITPLASPVELLILQHPMEVDNAKGSARLLHLSVAGSVLVAGETFAPEHLHDLLYQGGRVPILLYPDTPGQPSPAVPPSTPARTLRLVIIDGTWRKSRKMLYLNPLLQTLARVPLGEVAPSGYRIRKAHAPDQLSTLEAACLALDQLEGGHRFDAVRDSFASFVERFITTQGKL